MEQKTKILIVEDNDDLNNMLRIALEQDDFEVYTSVNGIDGITKAVQVKPDLILLDIMMPQMDGYEVLKALQNNTSLKTIVVVNSNLEQKKDAEKAFKYGAHYCLKKSGYTPFEVVEKVKEILAKHNK
jgi:DNA-binding response OmpR family regulator